MPDIATKIDQYVKNLPPEILGIQNVEAVEILDMTAGAHNLNYHIKVNGQKFIFRLNIDQQSGLDHQIEYEFAVLKFLEGHDIAPKAYHLDNTRSHFGFGILIEEYLDGSYLDLESTEMPEMAQLLAKLHALPLENTLWVVWRDPLVQTCEMARRDLMKYEAQKTPQQKTRSLARKLLAKAEPLVEQYRHLFYPDSVNHTDVVRDNTIKAAGGMKLIDWEKPRVDDHTYDLACFLCEPAQLWCSHLSPQLMNSEDRENFLQTYAHLSGKKKDLLVEKVRLREPLIALHWILWGATKLCDLKHRRATPELVQAHEERRVRYEKIADPNNIEKLLELSGWRNL